MKKIGTLILAIIVLSCSIAPPVHARKFFKVIGGAVHDTFKAAGDAVGGGVHDAVKATGDAVGKGVHDAVKAAGDAVGGGVHDVGVGIGKVGREISKAHDVWNRWREDNLDRIVKKNPKLIKNLEIAAVVVAIVIMVYLCGPYSIKLAPEAISIFTVAGGGIGIGVNLTGGSSSGAAASSSHPKLAPNHRGNSADTDTSTHQEVVWPQPLLGSMKFSLLKDAGATEPLAYRNLNMFGFAVTQAVSFLSQNESRTFEVAFAGNSFVGLFPKGEMNLSGDLRRCNPDVDTISVSELTLQGVPRSSAPIGSKGLNQLAQAFSRDEPLLKELWNKCASSQRAPWETVCSKYRKALEDSPFFVDIRRFDVRNVTGEKDQLLSGELRLNGELIGSTSENARLKIAAGCYEGKMRYNSGKGFVLGAERKFGKTGDFLVEVAGVEDRSDLLMHPGNLPHHSAGCVLLSRDALVKLRERFYGTDTPNACPAREIIICITDLVK